MLKRFVPSENIDGVNNSFQLPNEYLVGNDISVFVNGALYSGLDDVNNPYGFTITDKVLSFYTTLSLGDTLFIMYDDGLTDIDYNNVDWTKTVKTNLFEIVTKQIEYSYTTNKIKWTYIGDKIDWSPKKQQDLFDSNVNKIDFKIR